jgi:hypothetical protein
VKTGQPRISGRLWNGSPSYFLAGDTSYNQKLLLAGKVDGVSPDMKISRQTMNKIVALAKERPMVYLPSHDPEGAERLRKQGNTASGGAACTMSSGANGSYVIETAIFIDTTL